MLEGDWSTAAENFARAFERSDDVRFQYGLSRLLVGDLAGHRRFCSHILEAHERFAEEVRKDPASATWDRMLMGYHAKRLWFFAPQGTADRYHLIEWSQDEATDLEGFSDLVPLMHCRAGKFEKALQHCGSEYGQNWFSCALAHHYLGHQTQARECLDRGAQDLNRRRKIARIRGTFYDADDLLEAEVLRREAEKLVIKGRAGPR